MNRKEGEADGRGDLETSSPSHRVRTSNDSSFKTSSRLPVSASPGPFFHPSKRLGQNFLVDQNVSERIIRALGPRGDETIIEIGPGKGALTARLLESAGYVVAIEFDRHLTSLLLEKFGSRDNFKLVQADALVTDLCSELPKTTRARVVANLPYNISTAILQRLIDQRQCLTELVLMLQREVVDRITAPAAATERGYLSVLVEAYCETEKLFDVAPGAFKPVPKVWSSVVRLRIRPEIGSEVQDEKLLWRVVSAGFAQRRKTILNNLRSAPSPLQEIVKSHGGASIVLCQAEVDLQRRAETLTLNEWARIARSLE